MRIERARKVVPEKFWWPRTILFSLRSHLINCYVWLVLLYCMEGWVLTQMLEKDGSAWNEYVPSPEILRRMSKETGTHNYSRKFHYFGHTSRHPKKYYLLQLVLHDKSRWPGRRRRGSWLAEMWKWHACSKEGLKYAATSKPIIAVMIAKLRRRKGDEYISLWYRFF